jgi:hypothetical protein
VLTRNGGALAGYSIDAGAPGGDTFHALSGVPEQHGDKVTTTFSLAEVPRSAHVRFRLELPRGTDTDSFTELIAFTCSFRFLDSGKFNWRFSVNGTAEVETADAEDSLIQDTHDIRTELRRYWRDQLPLVFKDVDGELYRVVVTGFQENQPIVGPPNIFGDQATGEYSSSREAFYSITLTEV